MSDREMLRVATEKIVSTGDLKNDIALIADKTSDLRRLAQENGLTTLAYLLNEALQEAERIESQH